MSAQAGNKYAEKWTLERTLDALKVIDNYAYDSNCLYLGHALSVAGYYNDVWAYWRRKWKRKYEVISVMKRILQRFEVRLFEKMAKKEIPANVGMFALKHHYGWGREADERREEDFSYLEDEPITAFDLMVTEKAQEKAQLEISQEVKEEVLAAEPATKEKEFIQQKIQEYNVLHPTAQILSDAAYLTAHRPAACLPFYLGTVIF